MGACRVHKDNACHLLAAYEEALTNPHQGSISHLPFDTRGLQGISMKSLHHHITGALLPVVFITILAGSQCGYKNMLG